MFKKVKIAEISFNAENEKYTEVNPNKILLVKVETNEARELPSTDNIRTGLFCQKLEAFLCL